MLQCVAVCCSVLQCVAVCCSVLQCVAVCCSVLQCVANMRTTPIICLILIGFGTGYPIEQNMIRIKRYAMPNMGVATISRLLKITGLVCRISSLL